MVDQISVSLVFGSMALASAYEVITGVNFVTEKQLSLASRVLSALACCGFIIIAIRVVVALEGK